MSNAIPFVGEHPSLWRRWVAISWLGAVGMALGLVIFYKAHTLPLMLLGLLIFGVIAVLQPDMAVLAVVVTAPLFLIPAELYGIRHVPVRLPLHEVALLVSAGAVVARWLGGHVWHSDKPGTILSGALSPVTIRWSTLRYHIPAALLILTGILGVLWAVPEGRSAALRELRWLIVEPLLFYILLTAAFRRPGAAGRRNQAYAIGAFILSGVLVAVVALLQFVGVDLVRLFGTKQVLVASIVEDPVLWRVNAVYGSPNNLGLYLGRVWPIAAALAILDFRFWILDYQGKPKSKIQNPKSRISLWLYLIGALVCLGGIAVSFSRGAWLGVVGALVVLALPRLRWRWSWQIVLACLAFGATLIAIAWLALSIRGGLAGENALMRLTFWREAVLLIGQHPLGIGLDQFLYYHNPAYGRSLLSPHELAGVDTTAAHPHNLVLDIWLRLGPLGIVAFAWLILRFFQRAHVLGRAPQDSYAAALARGALAAMVAALIHGLVDNFYFVPDIAFAFWLLLALVETSHSQNTALDQF